jgi:uncharacterized protein (TIGR04255 family)
VISLDTGPNIPIVEREVFPKPPLKTMLGQARFPPILRIADISSLAAFQDHIRGEWPTFSQEQQVSVQVGPEGVQQAGTMRVARFTADDPAWSAVLSPEALTIEANMAVGTYTSYEEFRQRFASVWTTVVEHFSPVAIVQQGLRYVNHIERDLPASEWGTLINQELLGPITTAFSEGLVQAVADLRFQRADGMLAFKHGLVAAGPDNKVGYLLDFDYFTQDHEADTAAESLAARFDEYHRLIYSFFRWCVTPAALDEFRNAL